MTAKRKPANEFEHLHHFPSTPPAPIDPTTLGDLDRAPVEVGFVTVDPYQFTNIVVGVDPAITSGPDADETGIIVAAAGPHQDATCRMPYCKQHAYILQDATLPKSDRNSPDTWAQRVVQVFDDWNASVIVVEDNAMRELCEILFRTIRPGLPILTPNAGESKKARAQPVVALFEQGRAHMVGPREQFIALEDQCTTWVPPEPGKRSRKSPDRLDAMVWAVSELKIQGGRPKRAAGAAIAVNIEDDGGWQIGDLPDYGLSF